MFSFDTLQAWVSFLFLSGGVLLFLTYIYQHSLIYVPYMPPTARTEFLVVEDWFRWHIPVEKVGRVKIFCLTSLRFLLKPKMVKNYRHGFLNQERRMHPPGYFFMETLAVSNSLTSFIGLFPSFVLLTRFDLSYRLPLIQQLISNLHINIFILSYRG